MNKKIAIGVLGLAAMGGAIFASGALASVKNGNQFGPNYSPERHTQMEQAFDNNDYAAWKNLMGDKGAARLVTKDNFARFAEMHKLMEDGKTDEADAIRAELGLGQGGGKGQGGGHHQAQNRGGRFIDADKDGRCDNLK